MANNSNSNLHYKYTLKFVTSREGTGNLVGYALQTGTGPPEIVSGSNPLMYQQFLYICNTLSELVPQLSALIQWFEFLECPR